MPTKTKAAKKKSDLKRRQVIIAAVKSLEKTEDKLELELKKLKKDLWRFGYLDPDAGADCPITTGEKLTRVWEGAQLVFHNFARRLTVSARPITCQVLDFFSEWRTPQEAIAHFNNYAQRSVPYLVFLSWRNRGFSFRKVTRSGV